jgi:hypothetical protein
MIVRNVYLITRPCGITTQMSNITNLCQLVGYVLTFYVCSLACF